MFKLSHSHVYKPLAKHQAPSSLAVLRGSVYQAPGSVK